MSTENALLTILVDRINNDTLVLPTLPEVAVKVRQAADNPNVNLMQMADVISHDPALSARMIKVANSRLIREEVVCRKYDRRTQPRLFQAYPLVKRACSYIVHVSSLLPYAGVQFCVSRELLFRTRSVRHC